MVFADLPFTTFNRPQREVIMGETSSQLPTPTFRLKCPVKLFWGTGRSQRNSSRNWNQSQSWEWKVSLFCWRERNCCRIILEIDQSYDSTRLQLRRQGTLTRKYLFSWAINTAVAFVKAVRSLAAWPLWTNFQMQPVPFGSVSLRINHSKSKCHWHHVRSWQAPQNYNWISWAKESLSSWILLRFKV